MNNGHYTIRDGRKFWVANQTELGYESAGALPQQKLPRDSKADQKRKAKLAESFWTPEREKAFRKDNQTKGSKQWQA